MTDKPGTQLDKFKQAARELETDDDPQRFKERVGKLVRHKPTHTESKTAPVSPPKPSQ